MDKPPLWVVFTAPAKLGPLRFMPGETAPVSEEELSELLAAGVAEARDGAQAETPMTGLAAELIAEQDRFEAEVAATARTLAESIVEAAVAQAVEPLVAERDAAVAQAEALATELAALKAASDESSGAAVAADAPAAAATPLPPKSGRRAAKG